MHVEKSFFVVKIFFGGHVGERGGDEVGHGGDVDGETVEDVVLQRFFWGGDDDIVGAGFPSVA